MFLLVFKATTEIYMGLISAKRRQHLTFHCYLFSVLPSQNKSDPILLPPSTPHNSPQLMPAENKSDPT